MALTDSVDIYCERLDPGFWAEPVNALTNLAFLVAAGVALGRARRHDAADPVTLALIGLVALVGVGSFLFHTVATRWAGLADVIPIGLFILLYLVAALRRFVGLGWLGVGAAVIGGGAAIAGLMSLIPQPPPGQPPLLNGSLSYAPALLALLAVTATLAVKRHPAARALALAAGVFVASLTFRSIDAAVCPNLPLGTHFLWHILNGTLLFLLLNALIRHGRPTPR
ncbi:ceramidase domain-containing protein [Roseospirillum parvum]|uniref:Ceramidase n=1 Tax=Roseospirillum parvum TaxID=83401 RepID=A0A1G8AY13_9PROT|nr:ceramidase domain-containing protein [Roseospirillum parvum]SDH25260.1 Ceramidase [Roseospirillum parvum]